jgi:pyruvate kinase
VGGFVRDGVGLHAPNVRLPVALLTAKDEEDLAFGLSIGVDWVAFGFVQHRQDVEALRERIGMRTFPKIVARLEKPSALNHLDGIVEAADAVMVCRAKLGVELDMEEVLITQRHIVRACRTHGRPVVISTQVLDSMVHAATPMRAEAGDVAAAIHEGVDAIMLSAETATGKHALEAVAVVNRIARRVEADPGYMDNMTRQAQEPPGRDCAGAISAAVRTTAGVLPLSFAAACTQSGQTCLAVARVRPPSPILGLSPSLATVRMLSMVWGVHAIHTDAAASVEEMVERTMSAARQNGFAEEGRPFVMVAGMPFGSPGSTNLMRIGWA